MTPMNPDHDGSRISAQEWRRIKLSALAITGLTVAGIAGLMILAAGKDEDIAGIVASALFVALLSGVVAIAAAIGQRRAQQGR